MPRVAGSSAAQADLCSQRRARCLTGGSTKDSDKAASSSAIAAISATHAYNMDSIAIHGWQVCGLRCGGLRAKQLASDCAPKAFALVAASASGICKYTALAASTTPPTPQRRSAAQRTRWPRFWHSAPLAANAARQSAAATVTVAVDYSCCTHRQESWRHLSQVQVFAFVDCEGQAWIEHSHCEQSKHYERASAHLSCFERRRASFSRC